MTPKPELREIPLSEETVFHGILIDVNHMKVQLPNGKTAYREIIRHKGGVGVVPLHSDGTVTLVRQHRIAIDQEMLEIPAGKLESLTEDPLLAARRELEEETGLRAGKMELLTVCIPTPGYCSERLHLYLATELTQHRPHLDADEFVSVVQMPFAQAIDQVMSGSLSDAKTALALLMAKEKLPAPSGK